MKNKRTMKVAQAAAAVLLCTTTMVTIMANAGADPTPCTAALGGSNFEIDTNANLIVDGAATTTCIDWLSGGLNTALRTGALAHPDKASGSNDDAFGKGTSENNANPTIVSGSIPPNKSDLSYFGLYQESAVVELFWTRVTNPSGTTNMDFELNKLFCDITAEGTLEDPTNCANNGTGFPAETPVRSIGDKLITYDLSKGGTVPTISIRTWSGSAWSGATLLSGGTGATAIGSVNTTTIAANTAAGGFPTTAQAPYTFGEAAIKLTELFPSGTCGTLGSAYLKSRSSDSFSSELKDFISPKRVTISNCSTLSTTATGSGDADDGNPPVAVGTPITDTAVLGAVSTPAGGTITFHLYTDSACTVEAIVDPDPDGDPNTDDATTYLSTKTVSAPGSYTSDPYTPTSVGTYHWVASYSGDVATHNNPANGTCNDPGENSVVTLISTTTSTAQSYYPQDTATVVAGATGSVTFSLFGPEGTDGPDCTGTAVFTQTVTSLETDGTASTTNGGTSGFKVTASNDGETYNWLVVYGGDDTHAGSQSDCGVETFTVSMADTLPAS